MPTQQDPLPNEFLRWIETACRDRETVTFKNPGSRAILDKLADLIADREANNRNIQQARAQLEQLQASINFQSGMIEAYSLALYGLEEGQEGQGEREVAKKVQPKKAKETAVA